MTSPTGVDYVIVGRIRKAHGLRGDLIIESLTDAPDAIFASGRRVFAGKATGDVGPNPAELRIAEIRAAGEGLRAKFDGIDDRTEADNWRDRYLFVPSSEIEPLEEGEVYLHELPGMRVELASGEAVGVVDATYELPQGLALDVRREKGSVVILFDQSVRSVDREARVIRAELPEGLLD